jgi:hypothetical protein
MFPTRSFMIPLLAVLVLLVAHTPPATGADAKVSGMVTVKGKPLAAGKVTFYMDNGQFVGSKVKDGKYTIDRVPAGGCKVTVEGKGVARAFTSEDTTSLKVEVKEGKASFDFDLQ